MAEQFTQRAQNVLNYSLLCACELGHTYIGTEHILLGLLSEKEGAGAKFLEGKGITFKGMREEIVSISGIGVRSHLTPKQMSPKTRKIIEKSHQYAALQGRSIGTEHLLYAMMDDPTTVAFKLLFSLGVNTTEAKADLLAFITGAKKADHKHKPARLQDTPTLHQYGKDLTELAYRGQLDPVIGRDGETERLIRILSRRTKNNPCLIGEPGVGKTAVVEGLAQRVATGDIPDILRGRSIFSLDLTSMIAGAKYRGEFEERLKNLMGEIQKYPSIILFIDEIHTLIGAGAAEGAVDAANILKPALSRGEIQVIGATTVREYRLRIEKDPALERRFQPVSVEPPNEEQTRIILSGLRDKYEAHHHVEITDEAIDAAVTLSSRYISDRFLPDKAIDLIDEAASKVRLHTEKPSGEWQDLQKLWENAHLGKERAILEGNIQKATYYHDEEKRWEHRLASYADQTQLAIEDVYPSVRAEHIANIVTEWTGIPAARLGQSQHSLLSGLEENLKGEIIGQDHAIMTLTRALRRSYVGIRNPKRPIGCFLFLGPTGVGKTELCKVLARLLYGNEDALIRINMSEYQEAFHTSKLIGAPPGYVGFEEGGQLTEKVRRRPYSLVVFDEIEKAHADVYNLLLQILDDGCISDSQGRRVDFKNTLIVMTSNIGSRELFSRVPLGFSSENDSISDNNRRQIQVQEAVNRHFPPEFVNRIDETVVFHTLREEDCIAIAEKMLGEFISRLAEMDISLSYQSNVPDFIVRHGYSEKYGARQLKRSIVTCLEDSLAEVLVEQEYTVGDRIRAYAEGDRILFDIQKSI